MSRADLLSLFIIISCIIPAVAAQNDSTPPTINFVNPQEGVEISNSQPEIMVEYHDESGINTSSVRITIDRFDVTDLEETEITENYVSYKVPEVLKLKDGEHILRVEVSDIYGNRATKTLLFSVNTTVILPGKTLDIREIVIYIIAGLAIGGMAFALYILYLRKTKRFTFRKYFAQHPVQREYLVIYIPVSSAFLFILLGFAFANNIGNPFSYEYIVTIGLFIALGPYAVDSQLERRRISRYERSFSQFLFEMADAMRGGIDPAKAVIELSKTDTSILKKHLRRASDNIKVGRPFDEVLRAMVKPMKSSLIKRYASIIGESAQIGGEISQVVYRSAKDMDDMIKINSERRRQLAMQATIIYIAFGVMLMVVYQLITIFPSIESMDVSILGSTSLGGITSRTIPRMSLTHIIRRFLHLTMINSFGSGCLIGLFTDGKIKYGLIHALIMILVTVIFFKILII